MNDAILSSLLNLFALYNTKSGIDRGAAREVLSNYLSHHFGIRNVEEQLNFYDELVSHYDSTKDIDRDSLARETSIKVREKLLEEDRILVVLRFMEVQHVHTFFKAVPANSGAAFFHSSDFAVVIRYHGLRIQFAFLQGIYDIIVNYFWRNRCFVLYLPPKINIYESHWTCRGMPRAQKTQRE